MVTAYLGQRLWSLPSRERGLKLLELLPRSLLPNVAPFAGAWIEIAKSIWFLSFWSVAPFAGAWIEIGAFVSTPDGGRVAPFAGAWIEIPLIT